MLLSGALAGLAGVSQILGTNTAITGDIDAGIGFDAITVALLGGATPAGTVLAGLLFGAFRAGSVVMATDTSTPSEIVSIIEPVLVLFIAAPALIRGHLPAPRRTPWRGRRRPAREGMERMITPRCCSASLHNAAGTPR